MNRLRQLLVLLLAVLAGAAGAQDTRDDLAKALDYGRNLSFVMALRPDAADVADMLATSRSIVRLNSDYDKAREAALVGATKARQQERDALRAGTEVPMATQAALDNLADTEAVRLSKLYSDISGQMRLLARRLSPAVAEMISWSLPADVPIIEDDQTCLTDIRVLAAKLQRAGDVIERVRYLDAADYVTTRTQRLSEFLLDYDYELNARPYQEAMQFMFRLTDEARMVSEEDWPERRYVFAARALMHMGELGPEGLRAPEEEAPYGWWDLHRLLGDPQTPAMLTKVLNALNTAGGGE